MRLDVDYRAESVVRFGKPGDTGLACAQQDREEPYGLRVYADGAWYLSAQQSRPSSGDFRVGQAGDVPFCADFDGDGRPDSGVFHAGEWRVHTGRLGAAYLRFRLGADGDRPVLLNVAGRGNRSDRQNLVYGVYRNGIWHIDLDGDGVVDVTHAFGGLPQDIPLLIPSWVGSQTGYSLAIFRDGTWYVKADPNGSVVTQFYFGTTGDVPSLVY
jgi:hypothetical protein